MSPKQSVFTRPVLTVCLVLLVILFEACEDKIKTDLIAFKALDEGLTSSNAIIQGQSEYFYNSLENKLTDPHTNEKAKVWLPIAKRIEIPSREIVGYIETLKGDLKKEAGLKEDDSTESFKENDKNAVMRLFAKEKKGIELYDRLKKYQNELRKMNSQIDSLLLRSVTIISSSFDSPQGKPQDFTKTFFDDIPVIAALAVLSKFQNNIVIVENKLVEYCDNMVGITADFFTRYSPIISLSRSVARANESLEITAAIGAFSLTVLPDITINGKKIELDATSAAIYSFKAADKPGKHIIPVIVNYTDHDGSKKTITKNVEYTVADCQ